jgi:hypothetical protein
MKPNWSCVERSGALISWIPPELKGADMITRFTADSGCETAQE